jgi:hypothetical protein
MNGEILSIETSKKLADREKAIKYCQNILKREAPVQIKMYVQNILWVLEGEK